MPPPQPVEIIDIPSVIDNFVNRPDTHRTSVDEYLGDFALTERFKKQGAQPGVVISPADHLYRKSDLGSIWST